MSDTVFDISQYQPQARQNYSLDWTNATGIDPAWDKKDLEPDLGTNGKRPVGDALTQWQSASEFTLTLQSGQTVEVKFVPGLVGERRMHQFDFTGPISSTGFKSHFVLAVESEQFSHPRDYAQEVVAQHSQKHSSKNTKQSGSRKEAIAPPELLSESVAQPALRDRDNSRQEPAMSENNTPELNHTPVEMVEELSPEEAADRQRLELKVERAFHEAGLALRDLRDRRLYRNTHKAWEQYCQDRFGYTYRFANLKISAADVFDNLLSNCSQAKLGSNCSQILPTRENQCRELAKLDSEQQPEAWLEAIQRTPGKKMPTASTVKAVVLEMKGVVDHLKQKKPAPPEFALGNVVEIKAVKHSPLRPFARMWGIIEHVGSFSYTVRISIAKDTQQCKEEEMTRVDDEYTADIKAVSQRIAALVQFELEPVDSAILELLQRSICFTPRQLLYLERMEADYGLGADNN